MFLLRINITIKYLNLRKVDGLLNQKNTLSLVEKSKDSSALVNTSLIKMCVSFKINFKSKNLD